MKKEPRSPVREYLEAILVAGLFLLFANSWVLKTFYIPSGSMLDSLLVGDHLVVNQFIFGSLARGQQRGPLPYRAIRRGDIVVFRSPADPKMDLVKRCIGLPGDVVELHDKQLWLNGHLVNEPYVIHTDPRIGGVDSFNPELIRRDQFGPYT